MNPIAKTAIGVTLSLAAVVPIVVTNRNVPPEPPAHAASPSPSQRHPQPGHMRIDEHGWCFVRTDWREECTKNGVVTVLDRPHHQEDR